MSVYWFFDVGGIARRSLLAEPFADTENCPDVRAAYDRLGDRWPTASGPTRISLYS